MAIFSWKSGVSGDWATAAAWTQAAVPTAADDVTIDALAPVGGTYAVTIAKGESQTVNSLTMNGVNNLAGSNTSPYNAAALEIDGTLTFAPGSAGTLGGALQSLVVLNGGTIVNGGVLNGFIQVQGNALLTGTKTLDIANYLQALGGTITVDTTAIANITGNFVTGNTLSRGVFQAAGAPGVGAVVNLGGALQHLIVNIATVAGSALNTGGDTHLTFSDQTSAINEWNGTTYVAVETTLAEIAGGGVVDVLAGRDYSTTKTLTLDAGVGGAVAGLLNLQAGTVTTAGININGGIVQGNATIIGGVVNNGTLTALGGTLKLTGGLTGTGTVLFDVDNEAGKLNPTGATLEVNGVSAGQTIVMNGNDTLRIDAPAGFAGTIDAIRGGKIVLAGITATSAAVSGGALVISNGAQTVATLKLAGTYTSDQFNVSGSSVTITGEVVLHGSAAQYVVADSGGSLFIQDTVAGRDGTQTLPGVKEMVFTDGVGVFDATGSAEDVARLYQAALNRKPDVGGVDFWAAGIDGSTVTLTDVANSFTTSPEFIQTHGSLADAAFVNQLYQNVLGRPADAAGAQFWGGALASGASRGAVLIDFAESQENKANTISTAGNPNNAEVFRLYEAALGRAPDAGGQAFWSSSLSHGGTPPQVAQSLVGSAEFRQTFGNLSASDFVSTLYQNVLHRAADTAGLQFWTNSLQSGTSEGSVVVGFADSLENRAQTAGATHANWVFIPA